MLRLFVGINLPQDIRDHLAGLRGGLPGARWVGPETYHVTLRFIGPVDEDVATDLAHALGAIQAPAVPVSLHGLGRFGGNDGARALWAGVTPTPELLLLHNRVESACRSCDLAPELRHYHPHVTLARFRRPATGRTDEMVAANADWTGGTFVAGHFTLFRSHLLQQGAWYEAVKDYPLDGGTLPDAY